MPEQHGAGQLSDDLLGDSQSPGQQHDRDRSRTPPSRSASIENLKIAVKPLNTQLEWHTAKMAETNEILELICAAVTTSKLKVTADIQKQLAIKTREFSGELEKYQKTIRQEKYLLDVIEKLSNSRSPPNFPRFKISYECPELDTEKFSNENLDKELVVESGNLKLVVPAGSNYRAAFKQLHYQQQELHKRLELDLCQQRKAKLRPTVAFDQLKTIVTAVCARCQSYESLELDFPPDMFGTVDYDSLSRELYRKMVVRIQTKLLTEEDEKAKLERERDVLQEKVDKLKPRDMHKKLTKDALVELKAEEKQARKKKEKEKETELQTKHYEVKCSLDEDGDYTAVIEDRPPRRLTKSEMNANKGRSASTFRPSLEAGQGKQNPKGQGKTGKGKSKGKGKGKALPKGKGKGKGKPTDAQPEKGKGKRGRGANGRGRSSRRGRGRGRGSQ